MLCYSLEKRGGGKLPLCSLMEGMKAFEPLVCNAIPLDVKVQPCLNVAVALSSVLPRQFNAPRLARRDSVQNTHYRRLLKRFPHFDNQISRQPQDAETIALSCDRQHQDTNDAHVCSGTPGRGKAK